MNVIFTNLTAIALPLTDGKKLATVLEPNVSYDLNDDAISVASVGDNPSFAEELSEAVEGLFAALKKFVGFWLDAQPLKTEPLVKVELVNTGTNGIRVILGNNTIDYTLAPGATYVAEAPRYVELRELGV